MSFSVDARVHRVTAPSLGIENAQIGGTPGFGFEIADQQSRIKDARIQNVRASLRFPTRRAFFVGNAILLLVMLALVLWVLGHACAVIVGELARSAIVFFENYYARTHFSADGLQFNARIKAAPSAFPRSMPCAGSSTASRGSCWNGRAKSPSNPRTPGTYRTCSL